MHENVFSSNYLLCYAGMYYSMNFGKLFLLDDEFDTNLLNPSPKCKLILRQLPSVKNNIYDEYTKLKSHKTIFKSAKV